MKAWAGAAVVVVLLGGWGLWQRGQAIAARSAAQVALADLRVAMAAAEQAREAERVHRAHLQRSEAEAARWRALQSEITDMEGRDAPLSDYLRAVSGRLWP